VLRLTTFRMNTCKSVSKQKTLTPFRMNTCEKRGEGGTTPLNVSAILSPSPLCFTSASVLNLSTLAQSNATLDRFLVDTGGDSSPVPHHVAWQSDIQRHHSHIRRVLTVVCSLWPLCSCLSELCVKSFLMFFRSASTSWPALRVADALSAARRALRGGGSPLLLEESQQVGVDLVGVGGGHAMREARIHLQR
jgi:hypothetical protein